MKHINIRVTGKVQGVSFRATTKAIADQMGVRGSVRNDKDGSVYIEAEGDDISLEVFLEWCHVEVSPGELKNYQNFEVLKK
jgi:acylphosphatase